MEQRTKDTLLDGGIGLVTGSALAAAAAYGLDLEALEGAKEWVFGYSGEDVQGIVQAAIDGGNHDQAIDMVRNLPANQTAGIFTTVAPVDQPIIAESIAAESGVVANAAVGAKDMAFDAASWVSETVAGNSGSDLTKRILVGFADSGIQPVELTADQFKQLLADEDAMKLIGETANVSTYESGTPATFGTSNTIASGHPLYNVLGGANLPHFDSLADHPAITELTHSDGAKVYINAGLLESDKTAASVASRINANLPSPDPVTYAAVGGGVGAAGGALIGNVRSRGDDEGQSHVDRHRPDGPQQGFREALMQRQLAAQMALGQRGA